MNKPLVIKTDVAIVLSFFFTIIIAMAVPFYSSPAYGHANPVSYSPSANAVITSQQQDDKSLPGKVIILFSERP